MKFQKFFISLIAMFLFLATSCVNGVQSEERKIEVLKRVGEENQYEGLNVVTDNEIVKKVIKIVEGVDWQIAKVDMARPADYRFAFKYKNPNIEAKALLYELWLSPQKNKVELVIDAQSKYAQLNEKDSAVLFGILTGDNLSDAIGKSNDKVEDNYLNIRQIAWNFLKDRGWHDTAKEDLESSTVTKIIINEDYELVDESFEGKEGLSVSFKDKENVVVSTPIILVDANTNKVIGYMPGE